MSTVLNAGSRQLDPSRFLLTRVLPAAVLITVVAAWLRWLAHSFGWIGDAAGVAITTGLCVVLFSGLAVWSARQLRRSAETARAHERGDLYRMLARNYPDGGLFLFDRDLRYVLAESSGLESVGLTTGALEGRTIFEALEPEAAAFLEPAFRAALAGETSTFEMPFRGQHYRIVVAPVRSDDGGIPGGLVVTSRITKQKELEAQLHQLQKMEAIGQLAGGVAHDFNNLLVAIRGYSELVQRKPNDPRSGQWLGEILKASDYASALTRQLLAFSRKQVLQPDLLNVNEAIGATQDMLSRLLGERIEVVFSLDPELDAVVADAGQVNQVLINLAVNARDAMPSGGRLTIETTNVILDEAFARDHVGAEPGGYVMLAVSDTGHGMDRSTTSRIFEPFFTTKAEGRGTGLGLSTVYGIVKQSGGYVSVYSELDRGAVFRVYLPLAPVEGRREPIVAEPARRPPIVAQGSILVLDDDPGVRGIVGSMLREHGYDAELVASADDALARCDDRRYDLLITDLVMPGLDGWEIAEAIRARQPGISVVFTSGYTSATVGHRGLPPRAAFLPKPFTMSELVSVVSTLLPQSETAELPSR